MKRWTDVRSGEALSYTDFGDRQIETPRGNSGRFLLEMLGFLVTNLQTLSLKGKVMIDIASASGMDAVLPKGLEGILSERDQLLNRLPAKKILEIFENRESKVFVDKLGAMKAAQAGLPVPFLATILSLLFPVLLVSVVILPFFTEWYWSLVALFAGISCFKGSRTITVNSVRSAALKNPKMLEILMGQGVVYFRLI